MSSGSSPCRDRRRRRRRPHRRLRPAQGGRSDDDSTPSTASTTTSPRRRRRPRHVDAEAPRARDRDRPRRRRQAAGRHAEARRSSKGDRSRFRVVSDTADEIHVHGYDVHKDVPKGGSVDVQLPGQDRRALRRRARGQRRADRPAGGEAVSAPAWRAARGRWPPVALAGRPGAASAHGLVGQAGPADPALAVRVGGGGRAGHLVRRRSPRCGRSRGWRTRASGALLARAARRSTSLCGAIGIAVFAVVVYAGLRRRADGHARTSRRRCSTSSSGSASRSLSVLFGDVFAAFNPWRAVARAPALGVAARCAARPPTPLAYPAWLGRWPAAVGILAFAWLELVYTNKDDPSIAGRARARLRGRRSWSA